MSMLNSIRDRALNARKAGRKVEATLLTTLYAEAAKVGKDKGNRESTDEEVIAVVRKFIKNNDDTLALRDTMAHRTGIYTQILAEQSVLHELLPYTLQYQDIEEAMKYVSKFQTLSMKSMGAIKNYIDSQWPGSYDGARVSAALKARIS